MRSSVSYILSHAPAEAVMSHPDYGQQAQHHACLLVLVKTIGTPPKHAAKLWERLQRVNNIKVTGNSNSTVTDSKQVRDIWVRYVREYPVENNDWGDFQTHRRVLGLITLSKFSNQLELNENCRIHESLKVKYSNTLIDSRAFMFGPVSNMKKPDQEPHSYEIYDDKPSTDGSSFSDKTSVPSEQTDSLSSADSFPQSSSSLPEENFTTPSNFKASQAVFYGENDPVPDLEQNVAELINMLYNIVESKRLERSKEKLEKVSLLLAPFEKKDFVGLDLESRTHKKRCMGRVTKNLADLTLQAGLVGESLSLYHSAADTLKAVTDWLWLAAAKEGLCAASAILLYPSLRSNTPLQRNASLQENSPNKTRLALFQPPTDPFHRCKPPTSPLKSKNNSPDTTELTPSSSDSIDTSSRQSDIDSESLASSSDMEYCHKSFLPDLPSIPRQPPSQINNQYLLSTEEMNDQYIKAITHYSQYQNAGIIETEACLKAARIAIEQNNSLKASSFLQNVIFINLTLNEQEKIQRFDTLAELYKEIGFLRKAAFCQRLAATRQVSPNNPAPDWQKCYYLMLNSFPGHKLSLDPNCVIQHQVGWPALQIQLLQELVVAARRMVQPGIATRHMTFLLQTMWPHLSRQEQRDLAIQLQALSAACEGSPVPLVLSCGAVLPPASLSRVPRCLALAPRAAPPARRPAPRAAPVTKLSPFIFTPLHFAERAQRRDEGDCDFLWVEDDLCEVQLKLTNPLPFELKVKNMRLLTSGVVFETMPETITLPPETPTIVNLHGTPKECGELQILGYSTHTLGVKSNCRLKTMPTPNKFPAAYTIEVIPSLPVIAVEVTVAPSGNANLPTENAGGVTNISLYNGETTECTLRITNTSNVPVEFLDLAVQSNTDSQLQSKIFQWSATDIQALLPLAPAHSATIPLQLYGEADFLDLGGVGVGGEHLFPNSLNSNYPSRVGSPAPHADNVHEHGQASLSSGVHNRQSTGSFRSTNSHATSWSAAISVMPPTRGRQIETQVIIRYSGGKGVDTHCRQATVQINLELLPSLSITHWDVLPAEVPSQLYLVLDVSNLTCSEMEFHYTGSKHLLIESRESCRVPVPVERCPFVGAPPGEDDTSTESKSTSTSASTSLEQMCSSHVAAQVDLRWQLTQSHARGRASVRGLTLSQAMCDIVRASPLDWEVAVDSQLVKPQSEYTYSCGSCVSLSVCVSNRLPSPLRRLRLSVRLYRDFGNGATCYKRGSAFATAGNNKVMLDILPESEKASHECTVVFLTPGEYKVDIQCSTTEPILEDATTTKDGDANSMVPSCGGEINHVWRFIPPVAISVTD